MKIVKTEDKTVRFQNYTIDYENEIVCYVKMRNTSIQYEFEKNKKKLQYISDIQPLINSHWSDHDKCFKLKKFTLNELKNFKEFDKLFYEFINRGYRVLNFTTQASSSGGNHSGMWIICLVQAMNDEAENLNLDDILIDQQKGKTQVKEEVEGLYYIDDRANEL